jgi:hypothetical protein
MASYKIFAVTMLLSLAATFNAWSQSHKRIEVYVNGDKQKLSADAVRVNPADTVLFKIYGADNPRKTENIEVTGCTHNPKAGDNHPYRNTTSTFPIASEGKVLTASFVVKEVMTCENRRFTVAITSTDPELATHEGYMKPYKFHLKQQK